MRVCAHEKSEYGLLIPKNRIEPQISQLGEAERKAEAKVNVTVHHLLRSQLGMLSHSSFRTGPAFYHQNYDRA